MSASTTNGSSVAEAVVTGVVLVVCVMARLPNRLLDAAGVAGWAPALIVVVFAVCGVRAMARTPFSLARAMNQRATPGAPVFGLWAADQLKVLAVTVVVGSALTVPVYALLRATPAWWLLAWVMFAAVTLTGQAAMPLVLRAQVGRLTPAAPALAGRVHAVAGRAGVDVGQVMIAGQSSSRGCNAYVVGMGPTRRLVLETAVAAWPPELVDQVVAHEIGHWRLGHTARRLPLTLAMQLAALALAARVLTATPLLHLAGVAHAGDPRSYPLILCLTAAIALPARSILAWRDRSQERAADRFALRLLDAPVSFGAMLQRAADDGGAPRRLPWWRALTASHPPIDQRTAGCARFAAN